MAEFKLNAPIQLGTKTVETVTIKPLTLGDNEDAMDQAVRMGKGNNQFSLALCLLSKATGIPYDKLREMPIQEGQALIEAMNTESSRPLQGTIGKKA